MIKDNYGMLLYTLYTKYCQMWKKRKDTLSHEQFVLLAVRKHRTKSVVILYYPVRLFGMLQIIFSSIFIYINARYMKYLNYDTYLQGVI